MTPKTPEERLAMQWAQLAHRHTTILQQITPVGSADVFRARYDLIHCLGDNESCINNVEVTWLNL
jgi:hypothetical protein